MRYAELRDLSEVGPSMPPAEIDARVRRTIELMKSSITPACLGVGNAMIANIAQTVGALNNSTNPAAAPLAKAIDTDILPLLSIELDDYEYAREEAILAGILAGRYNQNLAIFRQRTPDQWPNPWPIPCFLEPAFGSAIERMIRYILSKLARRRRSEINYYEPIRAALDDAASLERLSKKIEPEVQEYFMQLITPLRGSDSDIAMAAKEIVAKHAHDRGYHFYSALGLDFLISLFTTEPETISECLDKIRTAVTQSDHSDQIVRTLDDLKEETDNLILDALILASFYSANATGRPRYEAIHSTLIGSSRIVEVLIEMRPILYGELCRVPMNLLDQFIENFLDSDKEAEAERMFRALIDSLGILNAVTFETLFKQLAKRASECKGLRQLADWMKEGAPPDRRPSFGSALMARPT